MRHVEPAETSSRKAHFLSGDIVFISSRLYKGCAFDTLMQHYPFPSGVPLLLEHSAFTTQQNIARRGEVGTRIDKYRPLVMSVTHFYGHTFNNTPIYCLSAWRVSTEKSLYQRQNYCLFDMGYFIVSAIIYAVR